MPLTACPCHLQWPGTGMPFSANGPDITAAMNSASPAKRKMAKFFARINMSELPAMSETVQELLALAGSRRATAQKLAETILKDYSLTSKILQVANSAYYSRGIPITTIERAVTVVGLNTIRDLAMAIALFEDFIKTGIEKESLSSLLARSFVSATFGKLLCRRKKLIPSGGEEAFLCGLFHNLGQVIALIYFPDLHRKIMERQESIPAQADGQENIEDLSFYDIGRQVGRFWNFSDPIILSMTDDPPAPRNQADTTALLQNIAVFSNSITDRFFHGSDSTELMKRYGPLLSVGKTEAHRLLEKCVAASWDVSESLRDGLAQLKRQLAERAEARDI